MVIFSNDKHAIVGAPTGGAVSKKVVTIPADSKSADFTILTNANKLAPGEAATAQITAYYGTPTTAQLRVTAGSGK